jgi:hypothetical protein
MIYPDIPNHCASGSCKFCTERRRRRHAQSVADSIACAKPSTTFDYWNAPARVSPYETFGPYPTAAQEVPKLAWGGVGVKYLHEPKDRTGHRKHKQGGYNL